MIAQVEVAGGPRPCYWPAPRVYHRYRVAK